MTVNLYALSSQQSHVEEVLTYLKTNGLDIEHKFTDLNPDAQAILTKNNLTIQPVLFDVSHVDGQDVLTKFAEGAAVMALTAEQITAVKTAVETVPEPL